MTQIPRVEVEPRRQQEPEPKPPPAAEPAAAEPATTGRLLIVSNRLPVTMRVEGKRIAMTPSSGGLATALRGPHRTSGGVWIGWPGDVPRQSSKRRAEVTAALAELGAAPVFLKQAEIAHYYEGFSNGVLWPLFHYLLDKVRLDASADWTVYRAVNERFADAVAAAWQPGDQVWVHDYQLALVPGFLRARVPDARIGFFLHIPFPAPDVFRMLPWRDEVLRGLLGADLVGFHTAAYRHNFAYTAAELLGTDYDSDVVSVAGRRVQLGVYPIGIDVEEFERTARSPAVEARVTELREAAAGKTIVLGVDRLDYTKGLPRRLLALDRLLAREPELRDRLHVVQIAVPSREKVEAYADLRRTVNELVGRINARYGTASSVPVHSLYRSVPFEELVALYRAADVMLVTPLRDGMNLVAKEYVATRVDGGGALVLSEFAGAAAELVGALLVNPADLDGVGQAIRDAIHMPEEERRARMALMREAVAAQTVHHWAGGFLGDLAGLEQTPVAVAHASADLFAALDAAAAAPARVLVLDYDGTLAQIARLPVLARPDGDLLALLRQLAALPDTQVHVVSGRSTGSLEAWLGELPLTLHAEHGFWSRPPGGEWQATATAPDGFHERVLPILRKLAQRTPGSRVEEKATSVAFHYRGVEPSLASARLRQLREALAPALGEDLRLVEEARVTEIRPANVHKGLVASRVMREQAPGTMLIAAGDDTTDEDLFASVPEGSLTIRIGPGQTGARHRVAGPYELRAALRHLAERVNALRSL